MKKKAPNYFANDIQRAEKVREQISDILGVGVSWIRQNTEKEIFDYATELNLPKKELDKIAFLLSVKNIFFNYAWAHFRFRNIENEFGLADQLAYDANEDKVEIKQAWTSRALEKIRSLIS